MFTQKTNHLIFVFTVIFTSLCAQGQSSVDSNGRPHGQSANLNSWAPHLSLGERVDDVQAQHQLRRIPIRQRIPYSKAVKDTLLSICDRTEAQLSIGERSTNFCARLIHSEAIRGPTQQIHDLLTESTSPSGSLQKSKIKDYWRYASYIYLQRELAVALTGIYGICAYNRFRFKGGQVECFRWSTRLIATSTDFENNPYIQDAGNSILLKPCEVSEVIEETNRCFRTQYFDQIERASRNIESGKRSIEALYK